MKKIQMLALGVPAMVLFLPHGAWAAGALGAAGSITLDGVLVGMAVLGIIVLVFMGLLLLARVRELAQLARRTRPRNVQLKAEDVLNMTAAEIGSLQEERRNVH